MVESECFVDENDDVFDCQGRSVWDKGYKYENSSIVPSRFCITCVFVAPHVALLYPVLEGTTCTASCSAGLARSIQLMNEDMRKHVFGNVNSWSCAWHHRLSLPG
jgi:hypothetical protein